MRPLQNRGKYFPWDWISRQITWYCDFVVPCHARLPPVCNGLLGLIVGISMMINLMIAGFFGSIIPLIMKRAGKDPATSATIFIATATDLFGSFIFLGLASLSFDWKCDKSPYQPGCMRYSSRSLQIYVFLAKGSPIQSASREAIYRFLLSFKYPQYLGCT